MFFQPIPYEEKNTLVLSIDFDGCTDTEESRTKLIAYITDYCKNHPQYTEVHIAIGSLRQSPSNDLCNALIHAARFGGNMQSCSILVNDFLNKLDLNFKNCLNYPPQVIKTELLMSDILNNLNYGLSLSLIEKINYQNYYSFPNLQTVPITDFVGNDISKFSQDEFSVWYDDNYADLSEENQERFLLNWGICRDQFESYIDWRENWRPNNFIVADREQRPVNLMSIESPGFLPVCRASHFDDTSKCLTLYGLIHYIHNKVSKPFHVLQIDDKRDLLDGIDLHYSQNKNLLPKNCSIQGLEWNSLLSFQPSLIIPRPVINGTGTPNPTFAEDIKAIVNICILQQSPAEKTMQDYFIPRITEQASNVFGQILAPTPRRGVNVGELVSGIEHDSIKSIQPGFT